MRTQLARLLAAVENAPPVEALDVVAAELVGQLGAREVTFLIADYSGQAVTRFVRVGPVVERERHSGAERAEAVPLAGTVYGQVLRTQQSDVTSKDGGARLVIPVTDRGDALGLLELVLPAYPDDQLVTEVVTLAHALAFVVIANRRYTDLFEWGQRSLPLSLSAEIQRRLLPASFTCEAGQLTVAGWLEPANSVGGDTFDYALDRHTLYLSITDATGHEVDAALLATLVVGSLRNSRRRNLGIGEQARAANDDLAAHASQRRFVTGQLMQIDLDTATATIVNAGHPLPLRVRDGRVEEIKLVVDLPFGLQAGRQFQVQQLPLEPGDRIAFLTDGMLERNAARLDVTTALAESACLHPRETVQALGGAVMALTRGQLRDDATVLLLDWHGGPRRPRVTNGGADRTRSSD